MYDKHKYSNSFFDYDNNGHVTQNLWYAHPCTSCGLNKNCVVKCQKKKYLLRQIMSYKKEERRKYNSPIQNEENGKKGSLSKRVGNNYCTHCSMSGHWVDRCWKLHPQLHPMNGKEFFQAPTKEKEAYQRLFKIQHSNQNPMIKPTCSRKIPSIGRNSKKNIYQNGSIRDDSIFEKLTGIFKDTSQHGS